MVDEPDIEYLQSLAVKVDKILREELGILGFPYDTAEARIYDIRNVGVQGDDRSYGHPAEITLFKDDKFVWDPDFLQKLSTRITNEVSGVNRVVYVTAVKSF